MNLIDFRFKYKHIVGINKTTNEKVDAYYPYLPCILQSRTKKTQQTEGLLDSGADGIVISLSIAKYLELELKEASQMQVADGNVDRCTSRISIILGRSGRFCNPIEDVEVSVPMKGDPPILLGRNPIFKLYRITFIEEEKRYEMIPYTKE